MTTTTPFEHLMERVSGGGRLSVDEIRALMLSPDVLTIGMLADAVHRGLHGNRVTYLRVASCAVDVVLSNAALTEAVAPTAGEVRITGSPGTLADAVAATRALRAVAGARMLSGFSWTDVQRLSGEIPGGPPAVLARLRDAGLDAIAELPLDMIEDPAAAIEQLAAADFECIRLTIERALAEDRVRLFHRASELRDRCGSVQALNPLPTVLDAFRPTTGYEDVKAVATARLAAPTIPAIQVDWRRYGPKLAQVALTFGADDLDGISASEESAEGRRRAPVPEVRRNIEAAGFVAVERDGRFVAVS